MYAACLNGYVEGLYSETHIYDIKKLYVNVTDLIVKPSPDFFNFSLPSSNEINTMKRIFSRRFQRLKK